tara:strand:+ start:3513 stop:3851 length:339 start_codon:yes stop_codon:yes gene_type:complete
MTRECPLSCGVCDGDSLCEDKNKTQCQIWGEWECSNNSQAVARDCMATCKTCTKLCVDKDASCRQWMIDGECEENKQGTQQLCPQSCGLCRDIDANVPFGYGAESNNGKEEL